VKRRLTLINTDGDGFENRELKRIIWKKTAFWDITPCSLAEVDASRVFTASIISALIALIKEAVRTSVTSVNFYNTTLCDIPEGCHLHTRHRENLKSHEEMVLTSGWKNLYLYNEELHFVSLPNNIRLIKSGMRWASHGARTTREMHTKSVV
jgi:hypothetical protein